MLAGGARIFQQELGPPPGRGRGSPGPGSASLGGEYGGSRKEAQRFEYAENSTAGFVELSPAHVMSGEEFFNVLAAVPGVASV